MDEGGVQGLDTGQDFEGMEAAGGLEEAGILGWIMGGFTGRTEVEGEGRSGGGGGL